MQRKKRKHKHNSRAQEDARNQGHKKQVQRAEDNQKSNFAFDFPTLEKQGFSCSVTFYNTKRKQALKRINEATDFLPTKIRSL